MCWESISGVWSLLPKAANDQEITDIRTCGSTRYFTTQDETFYLIHRLVRSYTVRNIELRGISSCVHVTQLMLSSSTESCVRNMTSRKTLYLFMGNAEDTIHVYSHGNMLLIQETCGDCQESLFRDTTPLLTHGSLSSKRPRRYPTGKCFGIPPGLNFIGRLHITTYISLFQNMIRACGGTLRTRGADYESRAIIIDSTLRIPIQTTQTNRMK